MAAWLGAVSLTVMNVMMMIWVSQAGKAWPGIPVLLVLATPFLAFLVRAARARVIVDRDGIAVRNIRTTTLVPWAEIERFYVGQLGLLPRVGILELRDGARIGMWCIQGPNPMTRPNNTTAEELVQRLNEELHLQRRHDDASGPIGRNDSGFHR